jgi:hypothetical protein
MDVPIEDEDALRAMSALACRAAMTALLKTQNPIPSSAIAW